MQRTAGEHRALLWGALRIAGAMACCSAELPVAVKLSVRRQVTDLTRLQWRGSNQSGWRRSWTGKRNFHTLSYTRKRLVLLSKSTDPKLLRSPLTNTPSQTLKPALPHKHYLSSSPPAPVGTWHGRQPRGLQPHSDVPSAVKINMLPEVRRRTTRGNRQTGEGGTSARSAGVKEH